MSEASTSLQQTASFWDANTLEHLSGGVNLNRAEWMAHPLVHARARRLLGGRTSSEWLQERLPEPVPRALGVGVGAASFELGLLASGAVEQYDLYDVSSVSLERAVQTARELGLEERIQVHCQDLLATELPQAYGLVTFRSSLHHATDLDLMVRRVSDALLPGGLLFGEEYVGPNRFHYPAEHSDLVKAWYRTLAPALRCPWPELPQPDPADVAKADPTEAVHSERILDLLAATFSDLEVAPMFGALPFILWWGLDHDALYEQPHGQDLVRVILEVDEALAVSGRLPTYFAVFLARC